MLMFIFEFSDIGRPDWYRCDGCGVSIHTNSLDRHKCDTENLVRQQTANLDADWTRFLGTNDGRFASYYAETRRVA